MQSFCQSDIVTLLVGKGKAAFSVHRELLCARSQYFRSLLTGGFAESSKIEIEVQEPSHAVTTFLDWLYKDKVTLNRADLAASTLVPVYVFADLICSEAYTNDLLDAIRTAHRKHKLVMGTETVVKLYESGLQKSQAVKFGMQSIVHDMVHDPDDWLNSKHEQFIRTWSGNADIMVNLQKEFFRAIAAKAKISPDGLTGCVFHDHKGGSKCSPKKRKRGAEQ